MPRKSATALATSTPPRMNGLPARLTPPSILTKDERSIFAIIAEENRHLNATDAILLAAFAQAATLSYKLKNKDTAGWERACRVMAMLGTKLRITPQAAYDPKTIGRRRADPGGNGISWWQRDEEEDHA